MSAITEIAWAAGFFDGEGCTFVSEDYLKTPGMSLGQVEVVPLRRFLAAVGRGSIKGPYAKATNRRPIYQWTVRNQADVKFVVKRLWKYLSAPKRKQATFALRAHAKRVLRRGPLDANGLLLHCKYGHRLSKNNTYHYEYNGEPHRACKQCKIDLGLIYYYRRQTKPIPARLAIRMKARLSGMRAVSA